MQPVMQALDEVKELFETVIGQPAPEISPQQYAAFPPGTDPREHVLQEVDYLKQLSRQVAESRLPPRWVPRADAALTKDDFVLQVEVPGVRREDVKVSVVGGECIIRGERKRDPTTPWQPLAMECPIGAFERRCQLPAGAKLDAIAARCADGILEIKVPIDVPTQPGEAKIEVS